MRTVMPPQQKPGQIDIGAIPLDLKSRDDIPHILLGLQYIYTHEPLRAEVFRILEQVKPMRSSEEGGVPTWVDSDRGRPGMAQWNILVLSVLRLGLNTDYDRLCELANEHKTIRQFLGHSGWLEEGEKRYHVQTLKDNLRLFTPDILDQINQAVVNAGHTLVKESPNGESTAANDEPVPLYARADSFVVLTDIHYPTDLNLLLDALRIVLREAHRLAERYPLPGWRQYSHLKRRAKRLYRKVQKLSRGRSHAVALEAALLDYLTFALKILKRGQSLLDELKAQGVPPLFLHELETTLGYLNTLQDQVYRRHCLEETIPHKEKIFSLFEPHTEMIAKGKAGVPFELGLRVSIVEDQYGFILHHQVMPHQTDDKVAVPLTDATLERFPALRGMSFDKGYHSPANQQQLAERLERVTLPKKGKLNEAEQAREQDETFQRLRRQHSAVESAINALEQGGLDKCPDHGMDGFQRYVALAVVSRNFKRLGQLIRQQALEKEQRRRGSYKKAA